MVLLNIFTDSDSSVYAITGVALLITVFCGYLISRPTRVVLSHWHHGFAHFEYAPLEFYASTKAAIQTYQIPEVDFDEIIHFEEGILGGSRKYLQVKRRNYYFDICAAPFGTGFYVSWYLVEKRGFVKEFLRRWPFIASLIDMKTYYQIDTEMMFKEYVHMGLMEAIDEMTTAKGLRALSESERQITDTNSKPILK